MDASERRAIEQECRDLVVRLTRHNDLGESEAAADLFTEDGTWVRGGKPYTGRAQLIDSFAGRTETAILRHMATNILIDVKDENNAEGVTYYMLMRDDPGTAEPEFPLEMKLPGSMGEWLDRFVRTPNGWRFSERVVRRLFQRA